MVIGSIIPVVDYITKLGSKCFSVPGWIWWISGITGLVIAQYMAFCKVARERDELRRFNLLINAKVRNIKTYSSSEVMSMVATDIRQGDKQVSFDIILSSPRLVRVIDFSLEVEGKKIKAKDYPESFKGIDSFGVDFDIPKELAKSVKLGSIFLKTDLVEKYSDKVTIDFGESK